MNIPFHFEGTLNITFNWDIYRLFLILAIEFLVSRTAVEFIMTLKTLVKACLCQESLLHRVLNQKWREPRDRKQIKH